MRLAGGLLAVAAAVAACGGGAEPRSAYVSAELVAASDGLLAMVRDLSDALGHVKDCEAGVTVVQGMTPKLRAALDRFTRLAALDLHNSGSHAADVQAWVDEHYLKPMRQVGEPVRQLALACHDHPDLVAAVPPWARL